ncbi:hypothetical protein [Pseudarthrobacter sp. fls2-241-R2A-168]|uniref:hypothetical protein n=1 Tax=Pseudarthrobacter sp. fls2-241-R2A-168 TaxID=3040304 RepID=UPI00255385CD|nr:hypothetical protein [Pseudarthrobacter sp. fls2-241-R2A-168]
MEFKPPLKIRRIAAPNPVHEDVQAFIHGMSPDNTFWRTRQQFDSVQFLTTVIPDPKNPSKQMLMYEAYVLYHEG